MKKSTQDIYISDPIDTDKEGNALTFLDVVADDESIADSIDLKLKSEKLYELIDKHLDEREKEILFLRYGLFGSIPLTQREVSKKLNISRSYVSRLETKSIKKLKSYFGDYE